MSTFREDVVRTAPGGLGTVRTALLRALRDAGFAVDVERTTLVEAGRGSAVGGSADVERLPVRLAVRLADVDGGTRLDVTLTDRWPAAAPRVTGLDAMYGDLFGRLAALVDRAVGGQGAAAPTPVTTGPTATATSLVDRYAGSAAAAARSAFGAAEKKLSGVRDDWPARWNRVVGLEVRRPDAEPLRFDRDGVDGLLDVTTLLGAQPGDLPPALVDHAERLAARIEAVLDTNHPLPVLSLEAGDGPALEFLRQQAALRDVLPERRLLVCRDCRLEKITNDEYKQITEKQRKLSDIVGRVTVVAPGSMLRQALRLNKMTPDFVCPRCQGLRADGFVVTFCPSCGAQHREGALRSCACGFDFRAEALRLLEAAPPVVLPLPTPAVQQPVQQAMYHPAQHPGQPPHQPVPQPVGATSPNPSFEQMPSAPVFGVAPPAPQPALQPAPQPAPQHPAPQQPAPHQVQQQQPVAPQQVQQHQPSAGGPLPVAGWYSDPWRAAPLRWWDGRTWTGWTHPPASR